ncbi:MAG: DNA mismatch repair endonuclease MutL [Clostridia bacterium]|nr:DNA mismatch repair endonuclease MutL [Clostridia bacterium]
MGRINLLDEEISNKIAAGEVVERPASVVKELVENCIDAGASKINVEIKKGGSTFIKVSDNGCGMDKEDAAVAFLRHATSKIKTDDDLNAIYTLGFRGEALSSIGAVAMVDLFTKRKEDNYGTHTVCKGGEIISDEDAGLPDGTTFIVKNLFYNVPARMKFLKKDVTEAGYINDIMTRFILAHPEISFKFINNGKEILFSSGDGNLKNAVYAVYGRDFATSMIDVDYSGEYINVKGMTGKGNTARPNRTYQSFFINGRYIKSPIIMRAVEEAYKNQIMIGKFPVSVLNIEINPSLVDINVHPTKLEVKFSNESEIYTSVYHAVKEALYRIADIPQIKKPDKEEKNTEFVKDSITVKSQVHIKEIATDKNIKPIIEINNDKPPKKEESVNTIFSENSKNVAAPKMFETDISIFDNALKKESGEKSSEEQIREKTDKPITRETGGEAQFTVPSAKKIDDNSKDKKDIRDTEDIKEIKKSESIPPEEKEQPKEIQKNINIPEYKLVGQVFDTYIIIETGDEMRLIDQHAAHERLKYEELKSLIAEKKVYSQPMIVPVVVDLSANEKAVYMQNSDFLSSIGFETEDFGDNSVIIRAIPTNMIFDDVEDLFEEILLQLDELKRDIITQKHERLLYTIACKAAIKANHKLSEREQKELVDRVFALENINTCPHGRPIVISMSKKEVEKQFKRIV